MKIQSEELLPYFSDYLSWGYRQDELSLDYVEIEDGYIRGHLNVVNHFVPSDGRFHLTVPLAFLWIAQLGIIYACIENGLKRKEREIYLREINLTCKQTVNKTQDIIFCLKLQRKIQTAKGTFYRGSIDIDNNSFIGHASFVFPLEKSNGT